MKSNRVFLSAALSVACICAFCLASVSSSSSWIMMAVGVSSTPLLEMPKNEKDCNFIPGLVSAQKHFCKKRPETMSYVKSGAQIGINECRNQFKKERWNCSITEDQNVFGKAINLASKETAFIYSIATAGVVYSITKGCSEGNLTDCGCDLTMQGKSDKEGWKWGGCSDNIKYGINFAKKFVDAPEQILDKKSLKNLMNMHNNGVGRQAIQLQMAMDCRCHGISGSCAVKSCWKTMPTIGHIGKFLKERYENSIELHAKSKKRLRRKNKQNRKVPIKELDMVHLKKSPNYCNKHDELGVKGTYGRECNKTSDGPESCHLLCCGRGFDVSIEKKVQRCNCRFIWCCYVDCDLCENIVDKYTCK